MKLTTAQSYELFATRGCYATEACDKCGQLLGPVRYTRKNELGVWCSRECRGDAERVAVRKSGRPRKYRTPEQRRAAKTRQQQVYRNVAVWKKLPRRLSETKDLQARNSPLSRYPLALDSACAREAVGAKP